MSLPAQPVLEFIKRDELSRHPAFDLFRRDRLYPIRVVIRGLDFRHDHTQNLTGFVAKLDLSGLCWCGQPQFLDIAPFDPLPTDVWRNHDVSPPSRRLYHSLECRYSRHPSSFAAFTTYCT